MNTYRELNVGATCTLENAYMHHKVIKRYKPSVLSLRVLFFKITRWRMTWHSTSSKLSGDACQREFESHPSLLLLPSARNCTPG